MDQGRRVRLHRGVHRVHRLGHGVRDARAENRIGTFAAECSEKQGSVYKISDELICVDKTGRVVWLDSQRSER